MHRRRFNSFVMESSVEDEEAAALFWTHSGKGASVPPDTTLPAYHGRGTTGEGSEATDEGRLHFGI